MNVSDLVREKGIEPKRAVNTKGGEYWSPCPGCGGTDRFHIWPEQNNGEGSYWCRGCEKGGDIIQFLIDFNGLSYPEACKRLNRPVSKSHQYQTPKIPVKNGGQVPGARYQAPTKTTRPPDLWLEKAGAFCSWAHDKLLNNPRQLAWLKKRGITRKTVKRFRLGWNPGKNGKDLWRPRESWGLPTILKDNGRKKALWLPRGLVIPLVSGDQVRRLRIRRPEGEPRYYVVPGSDMSVMQIKTTDRAFVIVESELDAVLLAQEAENLAGIIALGSSSAKPDAETYKALRQSAVILLALDFDAAGMKAMAWWKANLPQAERWPVPRGKDPGEAYQAGIDLREWVLSGLPPGWSIGQSLLGSRKKRRAEKNFEAETGGGGETGRGALPEPVKELAELLKKHPVSIHVAADRTYIRESQAWVRKNWEVSKRISELVFLADGVMEFLEARGVELITGGNINDKAHWREASCAVHG